MTSPVSNSDDDPRGPEYRKLLDERPKPPEGKGEPMNIIRRPVQLPPMMPIKDAGG